MSELRDTIRKVINESPRTLIRRLDALAVAQINTNMMLAGVVSGAELQPTNPVVVVLARASAMLAEDIIDPETLAALEAAADFLKLGK